MFVPLVLIVRIVASRVAATHGRAPPVMVPSGLPLGCPNRVLDVAVAGLGDENDGLWLDEDGGSDNG